MVLAVADGQQVQDQQLRNTTKMSSKLVVRCSNAGVQTQCAPSGTLGLHPCILDLSEWDGQVLQETHPPPPNEDWVLTKNRA